MSARKKAVIALIVGVILGVGFCVYFSQAAKGYRGNFELTVPMMIGYVLVFMLYAFGYAFGWKRCKGFMAKACRVSADVAFFVILIDLFRGKGALRGIMIAMFIIAFAIGLVWIPGVFWGIKAVVTE